MWAECAVVSACVGHHEMVHRRVLHPANQSNNINACGCLLILLGDLNVNLAAPFNKWDDMIAKQVDAMVLIDMSSHSCQWHGRRSQG